MAIDLLALSASTTRPNPSLVVVTDTSEAASLRRAWTSLQERCDRNELTQSPDWLLTWWRTFGGLQNRQLRLGFFHEADRLIGLAPLLLRRHWYPGYLPFRRLELLASGEPDRDGIYSNHIGILAEQGSEAKVASRLVNGLKAGAFGPWDEVVLPMMSGDTAMPELLVDAFRTAGLDAELTVTAHARYIPLPGSWEDYLQGLSPGGRRNIVRSVKAFDEWAGGTTKLEWASNAADLEKGREILIGLHHERWAGDDTAGVFRSPHYLDFHDHIMHLLAERGQVELLWLSARDKPVAALYGWVWDNKIYAYQTGRCTDLPTNLRPGGVLFAHAIRRAIEQGRREFDLLADDAFYKQQLTPHSRPLVTVRATQSTLVEAVRRFGSFCKAGLRRLRRTDKKS
jgi:CelD/BcsL family acetyltransferase involved in cellulose biosynthesis